MKEIYRVVGENIRAKRLQRGLTLEDLSELSKLHASYIGQIERDAKKASLGTIALLADALRVPVGSLFSGPRANPRPDAGTSVDLLLRTNTRAERKFLRAVMRQMSKGLKALK